MSLNMVARSPDDAPPVPIHVRDFSSQGQGLGLVASRALKRGELIFAEPPLIVCPDVPAGAEPSAAAKAERSMFKAVKRLPVAKRKAFYRLHAGDATLDVNEPASAAVAVRIMRGNAYPAGQGKGGLFPLSARINHCCTPNVHIRWSGDRGVRGVFAARDIAAGEQLLGRYVDAVQPRDDRRSKLQRRFGFTCACATCARDAATVAESDKRRREAARLDAEVPKLCAAGQYDEAVAAVEARLELLRLEGLDDPASRVRSAWDAYQVMKVARRRPDVRKWLQVAWRYSLLSELPRSNALEVVRTALSNVGLDASSVDVEC